MVAKKRRLTGIGMGPGDPELVTLKAIRFMREAEVIFAPCRRPGAVSLALRCAQAVADLSHTRVVSVSFPEGEEDWHTAARDIRRELEAHARGVMVVEGDPTLYSSFGHLASALRTVDPSIEIGMVPGVSSLTACAAAAGQSLGLHADSVAIVPATGDPSSLESALRSFECVAILKAGRALRDVVDVVDGSGRLDEAVYVRRSGRPDEHVERDLRRVLGEPSPDYWSVVIVGGRRL